MLTRSPHTHHEIMSLVRGSEADQPKSSSRLKDADASSRAALLPLSTFLAIHDSPPSFVVRRLLPTGVIALVDGTGQAGRSVALQFALAVSTGGKVFGRNRSQVPFSISRTPPVTALYVASSSTSVASRVLTGNWTAFRWLLCLPSRS